MSGSCEDHSEGTVCELIAWKQMSLQLATIKIQAIPILHSLDDKPPSSSPPFRSFKLDSSNSGYILLSIQLNRSTCFGFFRSRILVSTWFLKIASLDSRFRETKSHSFTANMACQNPQLGVRYFGNSSSWLLDAEGRVIGILTWARGPRDHFILGFLSNVTHEIAQCLNLESEIQWVWDGVFWESV